LSQGGQGPGRGIAEGAQCRQQHGQEGVDPLIGFALAHAEQAPVHHLKHIGLQVDQNEEQAIFRGRERTVLIDGKPADDPRLPIEAPRGEMRVERRLKGRD
jgi:hypothetical protein